jgi:hypothetical protein
MLLVMSAFETGCGLLSPKSVRTVYVPAGTPVRIRETIRNVKIWVRDASGVEAESEMDIPEGWFAVEDTGK